MPRSVPISKNKSFLALLAAVSIAFALVLWPFYGAIFWAVVFATLFYPLYRRQLKALAGRRTLAALTTLITVLLLVIMPAALIGAMLFQEAFETYQRFESGELSVRRFIDQLWNALPDWAVSMLDSAGLTSLTEIHQRVSAGLGKNIQYFTAQALNIGQGTVFFLVGFFIMLYLLFFLFRDGDKLTRELRRAIPLDDNLQHLLAQKFAMVIRATIRGGIVVALVQGALGGLMLWILGIQAPVLWGVVMAFLSLLPAVGTALVWLPAAAFLIANGQQWQGMLLIAYGILVIGLVDNLLRPILVGKETKMPDYIVFISTIGGLAVFGANGFVMGPLIAALFIAVWDVMASEKVPEAT